GSSAIDTARRTVAASEKFIVGAAGTLERYDHDHQIVIAREGVELGDPESAKHKLQDWDVQFRRAELALRQAQSSIEAADALVELVAAGSKPQATLSDLLPQVVNAVDAVREAVKTVGINVPGA